MSERTVRIVQRQIWFFAGGCIAGFVVVIVVVVVVIVCLLVC